MWKWVKKIKVDLLDLPRYGNPLRPYIMYCQQSHVQNEYVTVQSSRDASDDTMKLPRSQEADSMNLSPYFISTMEGLPCQEFLVWNLGGGMLLKYAAGYVPKYHEALGRLSEIRD